MADHAPQVLRTTADDDLFIRMDRALGVPVVNQMVWRLTAPPSGAELDRLTDRLRSGRLGRLLRRSSVPLVRDHWVSASTESGRRVSDVATVDDGELIGWIDAAASTRLDLIAGPVWELRSAPLPDGGAVVSLCVAHAAADGAAVVSAVRAALGITAASTFAARSPSLSEQAGDAVSQAGAIARNLTAVVRSTVADRISARRSDESAIDAEPERAPVTARTSRTLPENPAGTADADAGLAPVHIVSVPTARFKAVASDAGGSGNSLFITLVLGIVVACGRAGADDVVRISIPMSLRADAEGGGTEDDRANATLGLSLDLPASVAGEKNLAVVRALSKAVYAHRTASPSTFVRLQPVMQALGDRTVARLSRGATTPLALASSLGTLDDVLAGLGDPERVDGIVTRSTTQAISAARLRELRGGVAAWMNDAAGITTISVIGLDPDGLGPTTLHGVVRAEFARWSLHPQEW